MRERFDRLSRLVTDVVGSPYATGFAFLLILVWGLTGPFFKFSDTWQLVINTGTTIITFLMVFLIQASQNRDTEALNIKIDELIISVEQASNDVIGIEKHPKSELDRIAIEKEKAAEGE